jgi:pimeloyl-ACP methyl ester carboxylesterase
LREQEAIMANDESTAADHARAHDEVPDPDEPRARLLARLPVRERRLTLAGISTAILEGGSGAPLVLLHGPGGNAAHWARVLPELAQRHRVIVPDLPGHGATQAGDDELNAARALLWLDELCAQTCPTPPALVGELLAGAIALRFALDRPERLSRLVLVDSFGLSAFEPTPDFMLALTRFQAEPSPRTHEQLWRKCARDLPALRAQMGALWKPFEAYNVERARSPQAQGAQQALMVEFGLAAISARELARISLPVSLIWGRHDLATPLAVAEAASTAHGWPLFVIEDANDAPAIEQPDAFLHALHNALVHTGTPKGSRP